MTRTNKRKQCRLCGLWFHSLGIARHETACIERLNKTSRNTDARAIEAEVKQNHDARIRKLKKECHVVTFEGKRLKAYRIAGTKEYKELRRMEDYD